MIGSGGDRSARAPRDARSIAQPVTRIVLFAGGGTGGHLYPGLAIARALVRARPRVEPFFVGAQRGIERDGAAGDRISAPVARPASALSRAAVEQLEDDRAARSARGAPSAHRPRSSAGGSSSARAGTRPASMLAYAVVHRIPIVQQAGDSLPGLTARAFSRWSREMYLNFPEAARSSRRTMPDCHRHRRADRASARSLGPIGAPRARRGDFRRGWTRDADLRRQSGFARDQPLVADWIERGLPDDLYLIWATGRRPTRSSRRCDGCAGRVRDYLVADRGRVRRGDLALARAGAMTTAELFAWGIPAVSFRCRRRRPTTRRQRRALERRARRSSFRRRSSQSSGSTARFAAPRRSARLAGSPRGARRARVRTPPTTIARRISCAARPTADSLLNAPRTVGLYSRTSRHASSRPRRPRVPIHFVGIAGAGMSALAELFLRRGVASPAATQPENARRPRAPRHRRRDRARPGTSTARARSSSRQRCRRITRSSCAPASSAFPSFAAPRRSAKRRPGASSSPSPAPTARRRPP